MIVSHIVQYKAAVEVALDAVAAASAVTDSDAMGSACASSFSSESSTMGISSGASIDLLCGRGLGLGPQGRDPLVSGSTSPSVDSAFTLVRERTHTTTW